MFHSTRGASNLEMANPLPQIFLACTASLTTPVCVSLVLPSQSSTLQVGCRDVGAAPSLRLTCATLCIMEPSVTLLSHIVLLSAKLVSFQKFLFLSYTALGLDHRALCSITGSFLVTETKIF